MMIIIAAFQTRHDSVHHLMSVSTATTHHSPVVAFICQTATGVWSKYRIFRLQMEMWITAQLL